MLNRLPIHIPPLWLLLDDIGRPTPKALGNALGVGERTVRRWIREDFAPRPVLLSLFWLTRWGQNAVYCEAHNDAVMQASIARSLREQIERMQARLDHLGRIGDFGAANDPAEDVQGPRPPGVALPRPRRKPTAKPSKTASSNHGATKQPRGLHRG